MSRANTTRKPSVQSTTTPIVATSIPRTLPRRARPLVALLSAIIAALFLWAGLIWIGGQILGALIR